jgi:lysophospholipase L1-like esterase
LFIGDSFFALNHQITAYLEDLARSAAALRSGERYRDNSNLLDNTLALMGNGIAEQYTSAVAEAPVRVVVMNGGGADVLIASCDGELSSCPLLTDAAAAVEQLLSQMAADGVADVISTFYPDPQDPPQDAALLSEIDALRPLIQQACEASPVPCHWLDLRPTFAGNYDTYVLSDGMNPSADGSRATAEAIWDVMQEQCIAQ